MFYSQLILSKAGPLGHIWLAAHWDKKLTKASVQGTNLDESINNILDPEQPISLRTSGYLLIGLVKICLKKAKYLFQDALEAFHRINALAGSDQKKMGGRALASTVASYKAITLTNPEHPGSAGDHLMSLDMAQLEALSLMNPNDLSIELARKDDTAVSGLLTSGFFMENRAPNLLDVSIERPRDGPAALDASLLSDPSFLRDIDDLLPFGKDQGGQLANTSSMLAFGDHLLLGPADNDAANDDGHLDFSSDSSPGPLVLSDLLGSAFEADLPKETSNNITLATLPNLPKRPIASEHPPFAGFSSTESANRPKGLLRSALLNTSTQAHAKRMKIDGNANTAVTIDIEDYRKALYETSDLVRSNRPTHAFASSQRAGEGPSGSREPLAAKKHNLASFCENNILLPSPFSLVYYRNLTPNSEHLYPARLQAHAEIDMERSSCLHLNMTSLNDLTLSPLPNKTAPAMPDHKLGGEIQGQDGAHSMNHDAFMDLSGDALDFTNNAFTDLSGAGLGACKPVSDAAAGGSESDKEGVLETKAASHALNLQIQEQIKTALAAEPNSLSFKALTKQMDKKAAAMHFFACLSLKTKDQIQLTQDDYYQDIYLAPVAPIHD